MHPWLAVCYVLRAMELVRAYTQHALEATHARALVLSE